MNLHPAVANADFSWRDVWPRRARRGIVLPPGQRVVRAFPRFADNPLKPAPPPPATSELRVGGAVQHPSTLDREALDSVPRVTRAADFHCVTTWSLVGLRWSGWPMAQLWRDVIAPTCHPDLDATWLVATGHDGYRARIHLDDALVDDVLIVDSLEGQPIDPTHGAPLRLISPRQYGYKSVKYLCAIDVHREEPPSALGPKEHPRGRVVREERHARYPARLVRWPYRLIVAPTAMVAKRTDQKHGAVATHGEGTHDLPS